MKDLPPCPICNGKRLYWYWNNCPMCGSKLPKIDPPKPSIHFMFDNHTFRTLSSDPETAGKQALKLFGSGDPNAQYGMLAGRIEGKRTIVHFNPNTDMIYAVAKWINDFKKQIERIGSESARHINEHS